MSNIYDRSSERLQTTDEHGHRVYVHPEDLQGKWKNRRTVFYWMLILLYLTLPWIHVSGRQSILLDIPNREFIFFGMRFLGHDTPYLFFVFLGFAFAIGIITSIWGRVWCGWACPQTVFIETIFRKIERIVEGKSRQRMKLEQAPWNLEKIVKKTIKWSLFLIASLHITHSFLGYFVGARELFWITTKAPSENWGLFITMFVINAIVLFDFGWFREQFCIIMCPYGRLQSVMLDSNSMVVAYDEKRGEPRKGPAINKDDQGDCVNCYQCVKVCPTGIDIRKGLQLECIACTSCIDACDSIMTKLKKPTGLIRYTTENELAGKETKILRPRTFVYAILFTLIMGASYNFISHKDDLRAVIIRGRNPFTVINKEDPDPTIINHLRVEIYYQSDHSQELYFKTDKELLDKGLTIVTPRVPYILSGKKKHVTNVFVKFPKSILKSGEYPFKLYFYGGKEFQEEQLMLKKDLPLVGPY